MYISSICFCRSRATFQRWLDHARGHHKNHPQSVVPNGKESARPFPQCPIFVCMKGWKPWTLMSHFSAVSLRTRELPVCLLGWGPALGGLLTVLPVSQGPGEAK